MATMTYASYFGVGTTVERQSVEESVSPLVFNNGLEEVSWPLERTETISNERVFYDVWGICPDSDDTNNTFAAVIDTFTATFTERVGAKKLVATTDFDSCPGGMPSTSTPKLLTKTTGIVWLGTEFSINVTGKFKGYGTNPSLLYSILTEGAHIPSSQPITLRANGSNGSHESDFTYTPSEMYSRQPFVSSVSTECMRDWNTFTSQLNWFVPQDAADIGDTSPLLSSLATFGDAQADFPSGTPGTDLFFKITRTLTLSTTDNPRLTEQVEFYHTGTDELISALAGGHTFWGT